MANLHVQEIIFQPDLLEENISDKGIDFPIGIFKKIRLKNIHEVMDLKQSEAGFALLQT